MPLSAGELRTRITIEQESRANDGAGGHTKTWATAANAWAKKTYQSGGDTVEAEQTTSRRRFEYRIRSRTDVAITAAMRVRDGTMTLNIVAVATDDTDRAMTRLTCEEVPS
jgi:SPP1 family predicted phage head-tail adaptor